MKMNAANAHKDLRLPGWSQRGRKRGSFLFLGVIVSLLVLFALGAAVNSTLNLGKEAQYKVDRTQALAAAEGVTEQAQKHMLDQFSNFEVPAMSGTVSLGGVDHPYTITAIGDSFVHTDPDGLQQTIQHYVISSRAQANTGFATVNKVLDLTMTPLFQFMIFFDDDLEILPGANMTLGGRVHSNGSIYVGCSGTLTADTEYFRCTGDILRRRKDDNAETGGTVNIKVKGESTFSNMDPTHDAEFSTWATYALDTWKGTVQDGAHGMTEVLAPDIQTIKAFLPDGTKGYFHRNADLVVVDGNAYDRNGNLLNLPAGTLTQKTMYDAREGKTITVSEINVGLLNTSGYFPPNGLIYGYRTDATASQPNGIRLTNGAQILRPLSVVSEDPVYVKGDFNTVNKKGAAVIADAVNLLSNAWNDTKTATSGLPAATSTSYNMAVVSGIVPTPDGGGSYSGGFENMPRFHENWTGKTARIRGSFINIFDSEIAKSPWVYGGNKYTAPVRDWQYDPALNNLSNLPPFTPSAVYIQRVLWDDGMPPAFGPQVVVTGL